MRSFYGYLPEDIQVKHLVQRLRVKWRGKHRIAVLQLRDKRGVKWRIEPGEIKGTGRPLRFVLYHRNRWGRRGYHVQLEACASKTGLKRLLRVVDSHEQYERSED